MLIRETAMLPDRQTSVATGPVHDTHHHWSVQILLVPLLFLPRHLRYGAGFSLTKRISALGTPGRPNSEFCSHT